MTKKAGGASLPRTEFFKLFASVWKKAATVEVARNGFRSTGLFPMNPQVIPQEAFTPSLTTERDQPAESVTLPNEAAVSAETSPVLPASSSSSQVVNVFPTDIPAADPAVVVEVPDDVPFVMVDVDVPAEQMPFCAVSTVVPCDVSEGVEEPLQQQVCSQLASMTKITLLSLLTYFCF